MQLKMDAIDKRSDISAIFSMFRYGRNAYGSIITGTTLIVVSTTLLMLSAKLMGRLAQLLLENTSTIQVALTSLSILALESINIFVYYKGRIAIAHATNEHNPQLKLTLT